MVMEPPNLVRTQWFELARADGANISEYKTELFL